MLEVFQGLMIPFIGTALGAGCVFFLKGALNRNIQRGLTGFAAGVMVAASIWSLLIPAMEGAADLGQYAFVPAVAGFWAGTLFLLALDHIIPHLHMNAEKAEGPSSGLSRTTMLVLAVTLHNIPEGMAVGAIYAGWLSGSESITLGAALALSLGIAIQNFPEGAIISMPLRAAGMGKWRAFGGGVLSGADRRRADDPCDCTDCSDSAVCACLCGRCDALRCRGGTDPRDERGRAFGCGCHFVRRGILAHDDA